MLPQPARQRLDRLVQPLDVGLPVRRRDLEALVERVLSLDTLAQSVGYGGQVAQLGLDAGQAGGHCIGAAGPRQRGVLADRLQVLRQPRK